MADPPAKPESKGTFGFLTRKVGPLPVWAWGGIAFGAYYWYTHFGPGAKKAAAAKQAQPPRVIVVDQSAGGTPRRRRHNMNPGPMRLGPQGASGRLAPLGTPPMRGDTTTESPQFAAAPMTAGSIYGDMPTAAPNGRVFDPDSDLIHGGVPAGYGGIGDSDRELAGPYVPAG